MMMVAVIVMVMAISDGDDGDSTQDTYFSPINEDGVGRKRNPNKSVEGNCERVHALNLHSRS